MSFVANLFKKFRFNDEKPKQKKLPSVIVQGIDPSTIWDNISELGDGAFGKVYKAIQRKNGMLSALKSVEYTSNEELEDFLVEIEILTQFEHPNVLHLIEAYIFENKLLMYLEFCGGGAVDDIMKILDRPLTEPQIQFISHEVIAGLAFLHKNLIIHRDLKAGNILVTLKNEIRLADFGVSARMASENQKRDTFIGTPYWMAPEVIACETFKDNPYEMSADVWSFGIMLIEFAEMLPPFNSLSPTRVLMKIIKGDPPTLKSPHLWSSELKSLLGRCLQKSPSTRPTMESLKSYPFVVNVMESDRKVVKMLLCEAKAEFEETVEDIAPEDLPNVDPAMVSVEAAEAFANSYLETMDTSTTEKEEQQLDVEEEEDDDDDKNENEESYAEVEFNMDVLGGISLVGDSNCVEITEDMPDEEKVIRNVANNLIDDVILKDVDFTSVAFVAIECLKQTPMETQPVTNASTTSITTNSVVLASSPKLPPKKISNGDIKLDSTSSHSIPMESPPLHHRQVPDLALEVSAADNEHSKPLKTSFKAKNGAISASSPKPPKKNAENREIEIDPHFVAMDNPEINYQHVPDLSLEVSGADSEVAAWSSIHSSQQNLVPHGPTPINTTSALRRCPSQYRTSTRVRRFVVDGEEHTTTSKRVLLANADTQSKQKNILRKRALQDFRLLTKENKWRNREITERAQQQTNQLMTKLTSEFMQLERLLQRDLEVVTKKHKVQLERLTTAYETDMKTLRESFVTAEKQFMEKIKLKLEGRVSRSERKSILKDLKDQSNMNTIRSNSSTLSTTSSTTSVPYVVPSDLARDVAAFRDEQDSKWRKEAAVINDSHEKRIVHLAVQLRSEQFTIKQSFINKRWSMEQRHIQMKYQLAKSQVKDLSMAERQFLSRRLASQQQELKESAETDRDCLLAAQAAEQKAFLKNQKHASKKGMAAFQKKLRQNGPPEGMNSKDAVIEFTNADVTRRCKALATLERHQHMQLQAAEREQIARFVELDQQQSESKNALINQETNRLRNLTHDYQKELKAHSNRLERELLQLRDDYQRDIAGQADYLGLKPDCPESVVVRPDGDGVDFCRSNSVDDRVQTLPAPVIRPLSPETRSLMRHRPSRAISQVGNIFSSRKSVTPGSNTNRLHILRRSVPFQNSDNLGVFAEENEEMAEECNASTNLNPGPITDPAGFVKSYRF